MIPALDFAKKEFHFSFIFFTAALVNDHIRFGIWVEHNVSLTKFCLCSQEFKIITQVLISSAPYVGLQRREL